MNPTRFRAPLFYRLAGTITNLPLAALFIGIPVVLLFGLKDKPLLFYVLGVVSVLVGLFMLYHLLRLWRTVLYIDDTRLTLRCFGSRSISRADIRGYRVKAGKFHYLPTRALVIELHDKTRFHIPGWLVPGVSLVNLLDSFTCNLTLEERKAEVTREVQAITGNEDLGGASDTRLDAVRRLRRFNQIMLGLISWMVIMTFLIEDYAHIFSALAVLLTLVILIRAVTGRGQLRFYAPFDSPHPSFWGSMVVAGAGIGMYFFTSWNYLPDRVSDLLLFGGAAGFNIMLIVIIADRTLFGNYKALIAALACCLLLGTASVLVVDHSLATTRQLHETTVQGREITGLVNREYRLVLASWLAEYDRISMEVPRSRYDSVENGAPLTVDYVQGRLGLVHFRAPGSQAADK
jgi:hypothetical protein